MESPPFSLEPPPLVPRRESGAGLPDPLSATAGEAVLNPDSRRNSFSVGRPPNSPSPLALMATGSPPARPQRYKVQPPDLASLDYIDTPAPQLICGICQSPYVLPVRLPCDHYFCKDCLSHHFATQDAGNKSCPMCRGKLDINQESLEVPKIMQDMLDALRVRCPNTRFGCSWEDERGNVRTHVMIYCKHSLVECPVAGCDLYCTQTDYGKGCLHYTVQCEKCQGSIYQSDVERHQRNDCPKRQATCPACDAEILFLDMKKHMDSDCPNTVAACQGNIVGCKVAEIRKDVVAHERTCPMALMAPYFREQQTRLGLAEARIGPLERKVGLLERGLDSITYKLYPAKSRRGTLENLYSEDTTSVPSDSIPEFRLPDPSFPQWGSNDRATAPPPFDSQIDHLLTLHESLREEVSRIKMELNESEGRTNMLVFNENARIRDDMLHMSGALNNVRAQVHWMMSEKLRPSASSGGSTAAADSNKAASSNGNTRSGTQGASHSMAARTAAARLPPRRLSDSTRQETKL